MSNKYFAEAKNLKISPRKVRLIAEGIKKMPIEKAVATLDVSASRASLPIKKALLSAVANAVHNGNQDKNGLFISEILVNEGIRYKRFHYAARGRVRPYKKRTSHLRVILGIKELAKPAATIGAKENNKAENISLKQVKKEVKAKKVKEEAKK